MFLVRTFENSSTWISCFDWDEVEEVLMEACVNWDSDHAEELFSTCLNMSDFGEIATVIKIEKYMYMM